MSSPTLTADDLAELGDQARRIVAANRYLVLSTADAEGLPSVTIDELRGSGPLRLYEALASETSVLLRGGDPRNVSGIDTRVVLR